MGDAYYKTDIERSLADFFFEAMREGYALSSARKVSIPDLPGSKAIPYERDNLALVDLWFSTPSSNGSHGMTIIRYVGHPVWVMHYGGWYDEKAIPFLKQTLFLNYSGNIFLGGRGPKFLEKADRTMQYSNQVEINSFAKFYGHEYIVSGSIKTGVPEGELLGEHRYFGGLM